MAPPSMRRERKPAEPLKEKSKVKVGSTENKKAEPQWSKEKSYVNVKRI
jgi:hypothetical protein